MQFLMPTGGYVEGFGVITAPNHWGIPAGIKAGADWGGDIGCIDGPDFVKRVDAGKLLTWLETMKSYRSQCLFVAGLDVVGDAVITTAYFDLFSPLFSWLDWPFAYVAQDGAEMLDIPAACSCVFIGGSTEWKESAGAVDVIKRAQSLRKHVHIGRVNWKRRYSMFRVLAGSNDFTCDGTRTRYEGVEKTASAWSGYMSQPPLLSI